MLKAVFRMKKIEAEPVPTGIQCNACGRESSATEGPGEDWMWDFHHISLSGGYGDDYPWDLSTLEFVTCGTCLKKWTDTFVVPPEIASYGEQPKPLPCTHSETQEAWLLDTRWAYPANVEFKAPEEHPEYPTELPASGDIYEHYKGGRYQVYGVFWLWPSAELGIAYRALYGESKLWIRPLSMWNEMVFPDGHGRGAEVPRFKLLK